MSEMLAHMVVFVGGNVPEAFPRPHLATAADRQVPREIKSHAAEGQDIWSHRVRFCVFTATSSATLGALSSHIFCITPPGSRKVGQFQGNWLLPGHTVYTSFRSVDQVWSPRALLFPPLVYSSGQGPRPDPSVLGAQAPNPERTHREHLGTDQKNG